eukprot:scaffold944_cov333-Pavlova_lutheri.AAC.26
MSPRFRWVADDLEEWGVGVSAGEAWSEEPPGKGGVCLHETGVWLKPTCRTAMPPSHASIAFASAFLPPSRLSGGTMATSRALGRNLCPSRTSLSFAAMRRASSRRQTCVARAVDDKDALERPARPRPPPANLRGRPARGRPQRGRAPEGEKEARKPPRDAGTAKPTPPPPNKPRADASKAPDAPSEAPKGPPRGRKDSKRTGRGASEAGRRKEGDGEGGKRRSRRVEKESANVVVTAGMKRRGRAQRKAARMASRMAQAPTRVDVIELDEEGMAVAELAHLLAVSEADVVKTLFLQGFAARVNQILDVEAVKRVAQAYEVEVMEVDPEEARRTMAKKDRDFMTDEDLNHLQLRPPVVCVMGHVDHGKTSLLDRIRRSRVAQGEAGGITQGIGAYVVELPEHSPEQDGEEAQVHQERRVCFLDTPGHEAFTAMRARGAKITDIAVIVVAADDGVQPQTIEAVRHAQMADVPIVIAITKVDKTEANPEKIKKEIADLGLLPEEWGGDVPVVELSAKTGQNVDQLLETLLLVSEVEELMANPQRAAGGTVVEAHLDRARGPVATLLVQAGTLNVGDVVVAGAASGRARALLNDLHEPLQDAGPSIAVQMMGLDHVPVAGDVFEVYPSEAEGREAAKNALEKQRQERIAQQGQWGSRIATEAEGSDGAPSSVKQLNIVLKADASGSLGAIKHALDQIPQDKVMLRILLTSTGEVTRSDIDLAAASDAIIFAFNTTAPDAVAAVAKNVGVEVKSYDVIYGLLEDIRTAMEALLPPMTEKTRIGAADVLAVFGSGRTSKVAGCLVKEGKIKVKSNVEIVRGKRVVHEGEVDSLRRVKDSVSEVGEGTECGVSVRNYNQWEENDKIIAYDVVVRKQTLEDSIA